MKDILDCLDKVITTSGLIAKKDALSTLKGNLEMVNALNLAFNPFMITGIAKKKLSKEIDPKPIVNINAGRRSLLAKPIVETKVEELVEIPLTFVGLIEYFNDNHTGRDLDVKNIQNYIGRAIKEYSLSFSETQILESIITKSLTLGIAVKSINEVYGKVIPTFDCQLGVKLEGVEDSLLGKEITVTEKLDGNRCLAIVAEVENQQTNNIDKEVTFFSRNGKEIEGLDDIAKTMKTLPSGVYDGELLADDFNDTQSTLRTKGTKSGLVYNVFDYISSIGEFFNDNLKEVGGEYTIRRNDLEYIFEKFGDTNHIFIPPYNNVKKVEVMYNGIYNKDKVMELHNIIKAKGGEGVMINVNESKYIKDRTKNLVKVKAMKTCDIPCVAIESGEGRLANTLGYIICDYKGYEVKVGSGFDDGSRDYYYKHPEEIVNHIVEVQYFEETTNQDGTVSLRFPVFLQVRNDKEETSYE